METHQIKKRGIDLTEKELGQMHYLNREIEKLNEELSWMELRHRKNYLITPLRRSCSVSFFQRSLARQSGRDGHEPGQRFLPLHEDADFRNALI